VCGTKEYLIFIYFVLNEKLSNLLSLILLLKADPPALEQANSNAPVFSLLNPVVAQESVEPTPVAQPIPGMWYVKLSHIYLVCTNIKGKRFI
jgi:hypothetical protein